MSPVCSLEIWEIARFPRVSGDEPRWKAARLIAKTFSPREWG